MRYKKGTISIAGVRPFLLHPFTEGSIPLEREERTGVAGNDPEEWKRGICVDPKGHPLIPSSYIFACIRDGSKHTKSGRGSLLPKISSTLQVVDNQIRIDNCKLPKNWGQRSWKDFSRDPNESVFIDVRGVKNPASRARNIRYRIGFGAGWKVKFTILWDGTIVSTNQMLAILNDAGALSGLGDGRTLGYGRFRVVGDPDIVDVEELYHA